LFDQLSAIVTGLHRVTNAVTGGARMELKAIRGELDAEFTAHKAPLVSLTTTSPTRLSSTRRP
jgi:hypothetical protein